MSKSGSAFAIEVFRIEQQSEMIELWQACGLVVPWNDPARDIARKLQVGRDLFLIGEVAGEVVATAMGGYEGHRGWVNYLAVSPAHRRCGYGEQLMSRLEGMLRARGCPKINLQVRSNNSEVIAFYQSIGYGVDDVVGLGKRLASDQ